MREILESLEEIQAICVGADSPDAQDNAERDPSRELRCCQQDLGAISNIVENLINEINKK